MKKIFCRYPATISLFILLFCIVGLLINGCSKKDQDEKQAAENKPAPASAFFTVSSSVDPLVTAIAAGLHRQDVKGDIELQLSRHAGLPKWDNAMIAAAEIADVGKGETSLTDSVKVILIPFVLKSYQQTNAILRIKISSADTSYRLIYAGQYPEFGFEKKGKGKWNALNIFHLFTRFDNAIFGHKKFLVKDKKILAGLGANDQEPATVELVNNRNVAAKLVLVSYCTDYDVCLKPCKAFKSASARLQQCCIEWGTSSVCTQVWIDDGDPVPVTPIGGGSTPSPLPGGSYPIGGSGGGGITPIADPCTIDPNLGTPDHLCLVPDGGWQPVAPLDPLQPDYPSYISGILNLSSEQATWLSQHPVEAHTIFEVLEESLADEAPDGLSYLDTYPTYAITASQMSIAAGMNNCIEGPYDDKFWNTIKMYLPSSQQTVLIDPMFLLYFTTQCIILKAEHPEWGKLRLFIEATKETVHTYLDAAGMVPGIGEVADLTNGMLYKMEGDGVNAKLSFAAAIPIAGWAATTAKWAKKIVFALDGTKRTLQWFKNANNVISFGDRGLLRKVLGLSKKDARVAHHIIPWQFWDHPLIQKLAKSKDAFHLNERYNGAILTVTQHAGSHENYSNLIFRELETIRLKNLPDADAFREVKNLIDKVSTAITNNPGIPINNLVF